MKTLNKVGTTVLGALLSLTTFAQNNNYDLNTLATSISGQTSAVKSIVSAVVGIIFIAGLVHVIIAFINHSQNLKQILMSYIGAFIAFAALWAFL